MLTYTEVTDLVHRAKRFEELATIDGMTGLCNRRHFEALAEAEWYRFQRYQRPLSLMLVDIDHFKQINDRSGHDAGDKVLKRVAATCMETKRTTDIVARFGGDEFAILLPETSLQQARIFAERLRAALTENRISRPNTDDEAAITVSIGIAAASFSLSGVDPLVRLADKALYEAKAAGRNCARHSGEIVPLDCRAAG